MASNESATTKGGQRPARRTIVKGAAWAVPVVSVASAAPALAASPVEPPECLEWTLTGDACRHSVDNHYFFGFCIRNNCPPGTVTPGTKYTLWIGNHTGAYFTDYATGAYPASVTVTVPPVGGAPSCTPSRWYTSSNNASTVVLYDPATGQAVTPRIDAPQKTDTCVLPPAPNAQAQRQEPGVEAEGVQETTDEAPAVGAPAEEAPAEVPTTEVVEETTDVDTTEDSTTSTDTAEVTATTENN